jgi:hypothetical protein
MPKPQRTLPRNIGWKCCGFLSALWSAFRYVTILSLICVFFYVFPPYRIKQIFDAFFTTASTVGSMAKMISTDEKRAELFISHLTKSGRDLWKNIERIPNEI